MNRLLGSVLLSTLLAAVGARAEPGDLLWSYATQGILYSSPAIDDAGNLYIGSEDGDLYSLTADGVERWVYSGATDWIDSSPAIGPDGTIYFGCWDGYFYAVDGTTGRRKWIPFPTGGPIIASPAIAPDGTVYFVSYDGGLYALSPARELLWSYFTSAEIESSPALDADGNLYFGNDDGVLTSVDATGALRWSVDLSAYAEESLEDIAIQSSPAVSGDGRVYVGSRANLVAAVDAANGAVDWVFYTEDYVDSSPTIAPDGCLYVAARDGILYKIYRDGSSAWELFLGDVFYASPTIDAMGNVYLAAYLGDGLSEMHCIAPDSTLVWTFPFEGFNDSSANLASDGTVYFGTHNFSLYAVEGAYPLTDESSWPRFRGNHRQEGRAPADFVFVPPSLEFFWEGDLLKFTWEGSERALFEANDFDGLWIKSADQAKTQTVGSLAPLFFQVR